MHCWEISLKNLPMYLVVVLCCRSHSHPIATSRILYRIWISFMFTVSEFWDPPSGPVLWSLASTKLSLLPKASVFPSAGFLLAIGSKGW